jgi:hypothetical protein
MHVLYIHRNRRIRAAHLAFADLGGDLKFPCPFQRVIGLCRLGQTAFEEQGRDNEVGVEDGDKLGHAEL